MKLKFSENLNIIKIDDIYHIYSNNMNIPVGNITDSGMNDL